MRSNIAVYMGGFVFTVGFLCMSIFCRVLAPLFDVDGISNVTL